ncbi:MAG: serine hydrolase [Desulfobacterales bacterium]|nr:serine hydrolase [Desulfobacterales bacterium]
MDAATSENHTDTNSLPPQWLTASPSLIGFDTNKLELAAENIGQMKGVYSVIVARNNYLVLEQYFREGYRMKPHNLKSVTKSVMAALTGIAIEKKYLHLDQRISDFLPLIKDLEDPRKSDITVLHLLTMTSGLEQTSYQAYNGLARNETDWIEMILGRPLVADPGTKYQYSTGDSHLLSAVLTGATGLSTKAFAEKHLFGPMEISIKDWDVDPAGINQGGNNLSLIPLDMALFGQLYLNGGKYKKQQIIPKWWIESSTRPNYRELHEVYGYYSYLWYSRPRGFNAFVAVGYGGQYIYVSPEHNVVIVITSTLESKGKDWEKKLFDYIQNELLDSIQPEQQLLQAKLKEEISSATYQSGAASGLTDSGEKRIALATARLNLRKGPSQKGSVIKTLDIGTYLEILGQQDLWLNVKARNLNGWVSSEYVRFIKPKKIRSAERPPETTKPAQESVNAKVKQELEQNLVKERALRSTVEKQLQTTKASHKNTSAELSRLKKEFEMQRQLHTEERALRSTVEKQLQTTKASHKNTSTELIRLKNEIEIQRQSLAELETARKEMKTKLAGLQNHVESKTHILTTMQSDQEALRDELNVLMKELASAKEATSLVNADKAQLQVELTEANTQIMELRTSQNGMQAQTTKAGHQMEKEQIAERKELKIISAQLQQAQVQTQAKEKNLEVQFAKANKPIANQERNILPDENLGRPRETAAKTEIAAAVEKPDFNGIVSFVESWAGAWRQRKIKTYLAHYSRKFKPSGKISLVNWKKLRHQRLIEPTFIKLDIGDIEHKAKGSHQASVTFTQKYQSNTYSDQVKKTFSLQWDSNGWKILEETSALGS